ncbi:PA-phosphatase [Rufibacter radiotolerans]|uniref:PA-phosphatase n=1 Tax=Rufibacter radiotolerans TaxID=1379910 RepID=A0A0H4VNQ3_9BACT|nr:phosphatase PAP2 family protein [Rufibacter radiotolerans]AKQ45507.1 PA-phosphatase [Rufibacter radiotolerans]
MERLKAFDQALFLEFHSYRSSFWDVVMVTISNKFVWLPFYVVLIVLLVYFYKRRGWLMVLCLGAAVGLADYISSGILKPYFARLRPCHDQLLNGVVDAIDGCGGRFGFVSSHAANAFAVAIFVYMLLPHRQWHLKGVLLVWAVAISYSRVYLGVHYPGDVLAGALLGIGAAHLALVADRQIHKRFPFWQK